MKFPPKPKTPYVLDTAQDKRLFRKLERLSKQTRGKGRERLVRLLYSQLERDWRTPLEKFINSLVK